MKKIIIGSVVVLLAITASVAIVMWSTGQRNQKADVTGPNKNKLIGQEDKYKIPVENKNETFSSIPISYVSSYISQRTKDCAGLVNCTIEKGDLITILITDDKIRGQLKFEKYNINYLSNLKSILSKYTNSKMNSDFYATKVCSLDEDSDIITGYLYPHGESILEEEGKYDGDLKRDVYEKKFLAVIKNQTVSIFQENVQLCNSTATGAEVEPCEATLQEGKVLWSCFAGLYNSGEGDRMKYWLFDFNNSAPKVWSDIKYN